MDNNQNPIAQFEGYDGDTGEPLVKWYDRSKMPQPGDKLCVMPADVERLLATMAAAADNTQAQAAAPATDLHDAIMNLPAEHAYEAYATTALAYKFGHRDARHAAAELALAVEAAAPSPQSASVDAIGQGERALFEAWLRSRWPNAQRPIDEKTEKGYYVFSENNLLWEAWKARAALAHPSVSPAPAEIPAILFDGHAVYDEVMANDPSLPRATADNIADVLDAVVRLMRKERAVSPAPTVRPSPRISAERIEEIGLSHDIDAFLNVKYRGELGSEMTWPEKDLYQRQIAFARAIEREALAAASQAAPATCQPSGAIGQGLTAERFMRVGRSVAGRDRIIIATAISAEWADRIVAALATPAEPSRAAIDTEARDEK